MVVEDSERWQSPRLTGELAKSVEEEHVGVDNLLCIKLTDDNESWESERIERGMTIWHVLEKTRRRTGKHFFGDVGSGEERNR